MTDLFAKFGGIRPMAAKLGVPVSTVNGWHKAGRVPRWRHGEICEVAERHGIAVTPHDLREPLR